VGIGIDWTLSSTALLGALCIALLLWPNESTESEYRPPKWLALAGIGAICVLLGEFANAEMFSAAGELPPRAVGWFQFVFLLLFASVVITGLQEISKIRFSIGARTAIFALFAVSVLISDNFRLAKTDLAGPARSWHRSSVARLAQRAGTLEFDPLPPRPGMFRESGFSKSGGCWVNECAAVYLGAASVGLKGPKENHWAGGNLCDPDALVNFSAH
jgi:hypothetical protein